MDVGVRNPRDVLLELKAFPLANQVPGQMQRSQKRDEGDRQREVTNVAVTPGEEGKQNGARQREKGDEGKDVCVSEFHRNPLQTMKAITAAAPIATHPA